MNDKKQITSFSEIDIQIRTKNPDQAQLIQVFEPQIQKEINSIEIISYKVKIYLNSPLFIGKIYHQRNYYLNLMKEKLKHKSKLEKIEIFSLNP